MPERLRGASSHDATTRSWRRIAQHVQHVLRDPAFGRFLVSGAITTALGFMLVHAFLAVYGGHSTAAGLANATAYPPCVAVSYWLNRSWTFRNSGGDDRPIVRFLTAHLGVMIASSLMMQAGVSRLGIPVTPCWVAITGVTTFANFTLQRFWVFRRR